MNNKYKELFEEYEIKDGVILDNHFAMSPMVADGSNTEGDVTEEDVKYFERRAESAGMLISGAASIGEYSNAFGHGLGVYRDDQVEGLKKLAQAMKSKGAKAILQIFHSGRQAKYTYKEEGRAYGPSEIEADFIDYPITALSNEEIKSLVEKFGQATKRAIDAGFDGVEIHGANHYLIHQFFSRTTNIRDDEYGGSLENRSRFAIEITKKVNDIVKEYADENFIIGYRISPEEIHGEDVGYDLEDSLYLIEEILKVGVDYIHTSLWGENAYKSESQAGKYKGQIINTKIKDLIDGRASLIAAGDILTPDKALDALNYCDLVALASILIVEPDFASKIAEGKEDEIDMYIEDRYEDLCLPSHFYLQAGSLNDSIPKESVDYIRSRKNK